MSSINSTSDASPGLVALAQLFYSSLDELGTFTRVEPADMPDYARELLDHQAHMTVTLETHYATAVDLLVLTRNQTLSHYARKILLARGDTGRVVQYGIMRVHFAYLPDDVRREIERATVPLGRVLIEHDVLRKVQLMDLWEIFPGVELRQLLRVPPDQSVYGRTAVIHVDGEPTVEVLEIITPEPEAS